VSEGGRERGSEVVSAAVGVGVGAAASVAAANDCTWVCVFFAKGEKQE